MMAYYALHKFHKFPHELFDLPEEEQAFVYAAIAEKAKKDKAEADKLKKRRR